MECLRIDLLLVAEGDRFQRRIASLALSIGLILFLESCRGGDDAKLTSVYHTLSLRSPPHLDPGDKSAVCMPCLPMRIILDSPAAQAHRYRCCYCPW